MSVLSVATDNLTAAKAANNQAGTASLIRMRFLQRSESTYVPYDDVPLASTLSYTTDVRQFSGAFDFQLSLGSGESFLPKSHDVVEFYTYANSKEEALGVGFIETFVDDSDAGQSDLKANGRELIGQLINLPFKVPKYYEQLTIESFIRQGLVRDGGTYLNDYLKFRMRDSNLTKNQGAYPNALLVAANLFLKKGAVIQNYADLVMNTVYQNSKGQVEIYGRNSDGNGNLVGINPLGTLIRAPGLSNVSHIRETNDFSKVFSEYTVVWTDAQKNTTYNSLGSPLAKNTDPRIGTIYQPGLEVFSAADLQDMAGGITPDARIRSIAKSKVRKSMANVGAIAITTEEPYYTDPTTGVQTVFRVMQDWNIKDEEKGIDKVCRLAGIGYAQTDNSLAVQLSFVEPDTLA